MCVLKGMSGCGLEDINGCEGISGCGLMIIGCHRCGLEISGCGQEGIYRCGWEGSSRGNH